MVIKNGIIAQETGARLADVRIVGEVVSEVGVGIVASDGERVIDAGGLVVLPGGVDVHTHMDLDLGAVRATDDFFSGTVAAACGGTTTIVDHMAFGERGCSIGRQVEAYHGLAEGKAVVDYGFHGVFDHVDAALLSEMSALVGEGITSHKFYLTYGGKISDAEALRVMERAAEIGVLLAVHAENDGAVEYLRERSGARGEKAPIFHARTRPAECEAEAVSRMAYFAHIVGDAPVYIVHLSSEMGLKAVRAARERGQKRLFAETCPQYLLLDERRYLEDDGLKYVMSPPLRTACDAMALLKALNEEIDTVATDHCPFFFMKEKQRGKDDFRDAPGGAPGVEARLALMFALAQEGRVSLGRMVTLCCANPARLAGIYPKKGIIAPGSDADIVLFDPAIKRKLTFDMLHENTDYTPYEGFELSGWPVMTLSRGEIIVENGVFVGNRGRGKYLKRGLPTLFETK